MRILCCESNAYGTYTFEQRCHLYKDVRSHMHGQIRMLGECQLLVFAYTSAADLGRSETECASTHRKRGQLFASSGCESTSCSLFLRACRSQRFQVSACLLTPSVTRAIQLDSSDTFLLCFGSKLFSGQPATHHCRSVLPAI